MGRHEGPCSSCLGVQILFSGWWGETHGMSEYETGILSLSLKLDVHDYEKGGVGSFWFHSISRREPRFRGTGSAATPFSSSRQPWDPMAFHFITEELRHQMSHPLLMGLAASGLSPSNKLRSSLSEGFWPCCFPHLNKRSAAVAARGPAGQTEDGGGRRRKGPEGDILQSLLCGKFPVK